MAVWGANVPYLQSVSSPGEENAKYYETQQRFSHGDFRLKLGLSASSELSDESITLTYTEADSVKTMKIGDDTFSGTQVRALLSLPSASFSLKITDTEILITTKGNGHRVGMSQYGAEAMAVSGKTYDEILSHYYLGTDIETFSDDQLNAIFDKEANL